MKRIYFSLCFVLLCGNVMAQHVNSADYVVIPYTIQMDWIFPNAKAATLSPAEIDTVERIFREALAKYNVEQQKLFEAEQKKDPDTRKQDFVIDITRYKRQYVCAINSNNEKVVWINFLCSVSDDLEWKKSIIETDDGGNCYFQVKVNLTKKQYFDFHVNGN